MTIQEALSLRKGDCVTIRTTPIPNRPIPVTAVWCNDPAKPRRIVLVRLASIAKDAWLDATGYELPPENKKWDTPTNRWLSPAEWRELYPPQARGK